MRLVEHGRRSDEQRASIGRGVLAALASAQPARTLEDLALQGVPLSTDLRSALAAAAPSLRRLKLFGYGLSRPLDSGGGAAAAGAAASSAASAQRSSAPHTAAQLLADAAPSLERLVLDGACPFDWVGGWAPEVLTALRQCSRLEKLSARVKLSSLGDSDFQHALPLVSELSSLRGLRTLKLRVYAKGQAPAHDSWRCPDRGADALAVPLQRLTALTRLALERVAPAAVLPALPHLHSLAVLELPLTVLTPPDLLQLSESALALTRLRVHGSSPWGDGAAPQPPLPQSLPLPPRLQSLELIGSAFPSELLSLRLPSCCTRVSVPGLHTEGSASGERQAGPDLAAAASLLSALELLADRGFDAAELRKPFELWRMDASCDEAVPGGLSALATALGRLRLRGLDLAAEKTCCKFLKLMAAQLPDLEKLLLSRVGTWALRALRPLSRMRSLNISLESVPPGCGRRLGADLEALVLAMPQLCRLTLSLDRETPELPYDSDEENEGDFVSGEENEGDFVSGEENEEDFGYGNVSEEDEEFEAGMLALQCAVRRARDALRACGRDPGILFLEGSRMSGPEMDDWDDEEEQDDDGSG